MQFVIYKFIMPLPIVLTYFFTTHTNLWVS